MIRWTIDEKLLNSPAITNRNLYAEKLASTSEEAIITQYVGLTPNQVSQEFGAIFKIVNDLGLCMKGTGLELGAGVGVLSAVAINNSAEIEQCYAVEIVQKVLELLQPRAVRHIAGEKANKVLSVLGSFDAMEVPDAFFDFCVEYASLHHSDNLVRTLRETARVLKPGAPLVAIDRAHLDGVSDAQLRFMLDVRYSASWKARNGYAELELRREENGEHEIRLREWLAAFEMSGFEVVRIIELRKTGLATFSRKIILMLPFALRRLIRVMPSRVRPSWSELFWLFGSLIGVRHTNSIFMKADREHTCFILRKKL